MTRRRPIGALLVLVAAPLLALLAPAPPASAHPLGLPAFAQVVAADDTEVEVRWNAAPDDVAALSRSLGLSDDGLLSREQDAALAASAELAEVVRRDVAVEQDGAPCRASFRPPASVVAEGVTVRFACAEPVDRVQVRITLLHDVDRRYRTLASAAGSTGVERVMFTATEQVHALQLDPAAAGLLGGAGAQAAAPSAGADDVRGAFGGALPLERRFVTALDGAPGPLAVLVALLVALGVGALHALAPGHGKAVAAAYLVGERARPRDALVLGATVAVMHCGSVLVLGLALFSATRRPDAALLTSTITLAGGLVVAALGLWLLVRQARARRQQPDHAHGHGHGHGHGHAVPDRPLSRQGIVALGAAGGLLPSPSALLVLLTALALGRVGYGVALVGAFSVGLATTLTAVGVAVLRGRDVVHSRAGARLHRAVHAAPLAGAVAVVLAGSVVAVRAGAALA